MKRLTQKHYGASDYFMACSENCAESVDCTACPSFDSLVDRLGAYEDTGLTPEEINDLTSVREISPEAEYAINKHADSIIERLDKLLAHTDDDARLKELAEADKEGRVVVLPCKVGGTVIDQTFEENPILMKNIRLEIAYESRCGIIFQMGYDTFADLVEHGRIKPVSEEAEKALRRAENG